MQKRRILILIVLALVMALCLTLASCNLFDKPHTHKYSTEWKRDDNTHWRDCSCGEKKDEATHTVEEWETTVLPTLEREGSQQGECTVCGATVTKSVDKLTHVHEYVELNKDETGHWYECSCGVSDRFQTHSVETWTVDREATETIEGARHGDCSICGYTIEQTIPVIGHEHAYASTWSHDESRHWKECPCGEKDAIALHTNVWVTDKAPTTTSTGLKHSECSICHRVDEADVIIDKLTSTTRTVDFYSVNDFHGEVDRIAKIGGYLQTQKTNNVNTVLLNSGDTFQGSIASNSNGGKLLSDCMATIGFDEMTFGNHEFDWGLDNLINLSRSSGVPFLGANIYKWNASTHDWGGFADNLAKKYIVKTLDNGLKVGVIGVIGKDQITSISSNLVQTIGFKEPLDIIPDLATELRTKEGCDIVVVSAHAGPQGLVGEAENNQCPSSAGGLQNYVDAVFCAHTHREQVYEVDGLPFIQGGSSGGYVSHVQLSVAPNGNVTCKKQENISYSNSWKESTAVRNLVDASYAGIEEVANENLGKLSSALGSSPQLPRLVCRAIAEYAVAQGQNDIVLALTNQARAELPAGNITYEDLYKSLPFDNIIYIAQVSGSDLIRIAGYDSTAIWRVSGDQIVQSDNKLYKIAIIDYVLFHQNANRYYNYFPSAFENGRNPVALTPTDNPLYNYREITRDYLRSNKNNVTVSDYTVVNNHTNTSMLTSSVTFDGGSTTTPTHKGTLTDPYTVADALLLAAKYSSQYNAASGYVTGTVRSKTWIGQSDNGDLYNFYIGDNQGNSICVYYLKKYQGASTANNWSSTDDINSGDEIVLCANAIFTYNSSKPELYQCYCVTLNGQNTSPITLDPDYFDR